MRWWQIRKRNADLERELRADLELEEEEQRESGLPSEEARYAARRAFGNTPLIREKVHEAWGWAGFERLCQDIRYATRRLGRSPGFSIVAGMTLALGIGATTAIFTLVYDVMLRPLPFAQPDRLVNMEEIAAEWLDWHLWRDHIFRRTTATRDRIAHSAWSAACGSVSTGTR